MQHASNSNKMEAQKDIISGFSTIDDYIKKGFQVLLEATKSSNALPSQKEWNFYKTYDSFNKILDNEGDKVLRLMNNVLHNQEQNVNIRNRDLDEKMEMLIEANDNILEKVALGIDELNGIKKTTQGVIEIQAVSAQLPVNGSWNQLNKATFSVSSSIDNVKRSTSLNSIRLLTAKNIIRPQTYFKDKIDNRNTTWIPRITEKPNSIKPLAIFLEESDYGEVYSHPYEMELDYFSPPLNQLQKVQPVIPKPLEETPLIEVSTPEELNQLLEDLRQHTEFAVDLEHHSYRTFMGITCLLQISTKDTDYLVDTFTLRDKLCILNEVFTKPSIVKIFHGADLDVQWLQRDLSLYVVNMFDTHQAAKQLGFSALSLSYLLQRYCKVVPNKHFQLADWRIRPLPDELKTYARMDTHYLIYIYHMIKNELLKTGNGSDNLLKSVISKSTEVCKKRYIKPILNEESHMDFYRKCKRVFDNRQMFALKKLYHWRDCIARDEDESTGYVLPNHMLLQISESLPREIQGIIASCNPVPPLVRANLLEIHQIMLKSREQPLIKPILKEDNRSRGCTLQFTKVNVDSPLHCPHDLSKSGEFRDDLPTLLGETEKKHDKGVNTRPKSRYSIFNVPMIDEEDEKETLLKVQTKSLWSPYERYQLIKEFIQSEEEKSVLNKGDDKPIELTNEDRIAALHEHFVKVSKETPQKRVDIHNNESPFGDVSSDRLDSNYSLNEHLVANVMEYPVLKSLYNKKGKKRKRKANLDDEYVEPKQKVPCNEIQEVQTPAPNFKKGNNPPSRRNKKKKKKQNQNIHCELGKSELVSAPSQQSNMSRKQIKAKKWKDRKKQIQREKQFQDQTFKQFDYSSVNFQQFQGGAGISNNQKRQSQTNFKAKNKRKKNNRNSNKSMTFSRLH